MTDYNRREFIKKAILTGSLAAGVGSAGAMFYRDGSAIASPTPLPTLNDYRVVESTVLPKLVIARGSDPAKNVRAAIDAIGGMGRFISKGESVTIKPNLGFERTPEQAGCTNPLVVAEIAKMCSEAGASVVRVGDNPCVDPRRSYNLSGLVKAIEPLDAKIIYPAENVSYKEMAVPGERIKSWPVFAALAESDRMINVPIAKHHSLAGLTLGMKNWFGIIGGRRNQLHQDINSTIVDLARLVRPTLTVVDATRILIANGPSGGRLDDVKQMDTIIAATDPVAADSFAAGLFDKTPDDIKYIAAAAKAGLGSADWKNISFKEIKVG